MQWSWRIEPPTPEVDIPILNVCSIWNLVSMAIHSTHLRFMPRSNLLPRRAEERIDFLWDLSTSVVSQPAVIVEIHDLREGSTICASYIFIFTRFSNLHLISRYMIYQSMLCIVPLRRLVRVYLWIYYHAMTFWNFSTLWFVSLDTKRCRPRTFSGLCLNDPIHVPWFLFEWNQIRESHCRKGYHLLKECHGMSRIGWDGSLPNSISVNTIEYHFINCY